jgi:hypothetical protein
MVSEIYGLFSGRDGHVRYVGMTAGDRHDRFKEHQRPTSEGVIIPVLGWIRHEWRCGYPVECVLLESCDYGVRRDVETEWINKFPNLLNERKVYWRRDKKPPVIPAIKKYKRRFIFNSGGFRGIHWWREWDIYSVFVDGSWLWGDSRPGGDWDIYFSCRTDALIAREKHRRGRSGWLPDITQEMDVLDCGVQLPDTCGFDFDPSMHAAECNTAFKSEFAGTIA